ncbi:MAG: hypothetical protein IJU39_00725 [Clostridia bacterium]|nr:hypothetical protein [Clostridia bacterium]
MKKTESKSLSEFIRAINADADKACESIKNDALKEKRERLNDAAKQLESECLESIAKAEKSVRSEGNKTLTDLENKMRNELIEKRDQISRNVFAKVEAKLSDFVKTDGYRELLKKSAAQIGERIKGENLIIFARSEDLAYEDDIKKAVGRKCILRQDNTIKLGGLKASTDIQAADDTLDCRLKNEREWFVNNSELKIV